MDNNTFKNIAQYYGIKMSALSSYLAIVWNRFNWFLTLSVGIFSLYFNAIEKNPYFLFKIGIPIIGIVLSLLWLLIGIEDYSTLKKQNEKTSNINNHIKELFKNEKIDMFLMENKDSYLNFTQSLILFIFPFLSLFCWAMVTYFQF